MNVFRFRRHLSARVTPSLWAAMRAVAAVALLAAVGAAATFAATPQQPPKKDEAPVNAPHAILIDAENGAVLFERAPDDMIFPASLAKLMTAEYVFNEIKQGRVKLTDEYVVSENAWRKGGAPSGGSTMFAAIHSRISLNDLLHGMIIQSANDACIMIAEALAGNEEEFGRKLTQRARDIGMAQSVFTNSNGLPDPRTKVNSRELSILARQIIQNYPDLYSIYGEREFTWNKIRQQNRNPLLGTVNGADGLKTGFTSEAGYGLVGSAVQNGLRLIVVVNGLKTAKDRADEGKKLLEWGFRNFEPRILFGEGQTVGSAKVFGGTAGSVPLVTAKAVRIMVPKNNNERIVARISYRGPVVAPVAAGTQIGMLKVWRGDNIVLQAPLQTAAGVERGGLTGRAIDAVAEAMIGLFRSSAERL